MFVVHQADFFEDDTLANGLGSILMGRGAGPMLKHRLLDQIIAGPLPEEPDLSVAQGLFDVVEHELIAYGTGGSHLTDHDSARIIRALEIVTRRLGVPINLPFRDFSTFRAYWTRMDAGGSGGWARRRTLVAELFEPARARLTAISTHVGPELAEDLIVNLRDPAAIREHLRRLHGVAETDPPLAIGTAKELVESTAKTVLLQLGRPPSDKADMPTLVRQAQEALGLLPTSRTAGPDGTQALQRILGGLMNVTNGLGELRNRGYGTGHGPGGARVGLRPRHARLAVNAAVTWCSLILDTFGDPEAPWRTARTTPAIGPVP
jgi:Abortive infection C-terminus